MALTSENGLHRKTELSPPQPQHGPPAQTGKMEVMLASYPIKTCIVCGEEFELKPGKPGFANRCPDCSEEGAAGPQGKRRMDADERRTQTEANAERRRVMRDLLYRKDS